MALRPVFWQQRAHRIFVLYDKNCDYRARVSASYGERLPEDRPNLLELDSALARLLFTRVRCDDEIRAAHFDPDLVFCRGEREHQKTGEDSSG